MNDKLIIFDDCKFQIPNNITGVINPNIYADESKYPKNLKVWAGKKYIILREEFNKKTKLQKRENVFLCVGGSDPVNQISKLTNILLKNTLL